MIQELVLLSKRIRSENADGTVCHDALKTEPVSIDCVIDNDGKFLEFVLLPEKVMTMAEAIAAKKGKARLLVDKCEEVLNIYAKDSVEDRPIKKHEMFLSKLYSYESIEAIQPVLKFYKIPSLGVECACEAFLKTIPEKERIGNIAFRVFGKSIRLNEEVAIIEEIIRNFDSSQNDQVDGTRCSVCGSVDYPVHDAPHGMIKRVPDGQSSGCALVSYNNTAFESYLQKGNENSSICTHCAKAYVEALNWLLSNGSEMQNDKGKTKFTYSNRQKINSDTAFVFWTKEETNLGFLDLLDNPNEDEIRNLIKSPFSTKREALSLSFNRFYGLTLSGAAARIAVRDWIEESVEQVTSSLQRWFADIAIYISGSKAEPGSVIYPSITSLIYCCRREKDNNDHVAGRIGAALWRSALKDQPIPFSTLSTLLNRIRAEGGKVTKERAALIKLILNRSHYTTKGESKYMESLDEKRKEPSYLCGRLFAVLERLQYHAQGDVNAGIGERFFTAASSTPAPTFGRLLKLSKQHLSKLKGEKPGLAVNIDKEIQAICDGIREFPNIFRLEEQGAFALGYYHQKNKKSETVNEQQ